MTKIDKDEAVRLRDEEGMNNQEIADEFKVSRQAVSEMFEKLDKEEKKEETPPDDDEGKYLDELEGEGQKEDEDPDEDDLCPNCGEELAPTQHEGIFVCTNCKELYS